MPPSSQIFPTAQITHYEKLGAWTDSSIYSLFKMQANKSPDAMAVADPLNRTQLCFGQSKQLNYRELDYACRSLAETLSNSGISSGDIVILQLPNIVELVTCYLALARLGAIASPIAMQFRKHELDKIIDQTSAHAYITLESFKGFPHAQYFCDSFPNFDGVQLEITEATSLRPQQHLHWTLPERIPSKLENDTWTDSIDANSIFTICWTSGTEGFPKGVPRSHNNWRCSGIAVSGGFKISEKQNFLLPFPMINTAAMGGVFMPWLLNGGKLVLHHPFDLDCFAQQILTEEISVALASPALLESYLQDDDKSAALRNSTLKKIGVGSAPPSARLFREFKDKFRINLINMFGSNEGLFLGEDLSDVLSPEQLSRYFPRFGHAEHQWDNIAAQWLQCKLVNPESGETIENSEEQGELFVKGPSIFPGYYNKGQLDKSAFDENGYFNTKDLFKLKADKQELRYLVAIGRSKEIIIRGGFNIAPTELDNILMDIDVILEAATGPYPDPRLGERVCAYVVLKEGCQLTLGDISKQMEQVGLAQYKWPEKLVFLEKLPRNPLNKILRRELINTID